MQQSKSCLGQLIRTWIETASVLLQVCCNARIHPWHVDERKQLRQKPLECRLGGVQTGQLAVSNQKFAAQDQVSLPSLFPLWQKTRLVRIQLLTVTAARDPDLHASW